MVKRGAAVVLVIVLASIAAMAAPREAAALGQPSPYESLVTSRSASSFWTKWLGFLSGSATPETAAYGTLVGGETPTTQAGVKSMLYRARVGARFLPKLGIVASRLSLLGAAGYIGWRIYTHYQGNDVTVDVWLDSNTLGKDALYNPLAVWGTHQDRLRYGSVVWTRQAGTRCSTVGLGSDCWILDVSAGGLNGLGSYKVANRINNQAEGSIARTHWPDWDQCDALGIESTCMGGWSSYPGYLDSAWGAQTNYMVDRTFQNLGDRTFDGYATTLTRFPDEVVAGVDALQVALPLGAIGPDAGVVAGSEGTLPGAPEVETDYPVPADAGTTIADTIDGLAPFDSPCGRALINHLMQPSFYPWVPGCIETAPESEPEAETFTLLRPLSTETYAEYITRLQAEGWLGTATLVELDPYDPLIGPEAVSKVGVTGTTGTWRRTLWPPTWPKLAITTNLTIHHNPTTAPPVSPDPTDEEAPPGGGDVFDPGGCEPWLEADPNFGPLLGLDFGDAFPFAVFGWVAGMVGQFDVSPVAPSWDFHIVIPATSVTGETDLGHFVVNLDWADSYMATVRTILSFVLWVGALWYFATALLGIRAPGNPAEAVDEA